jgi:hypothetical protein
VWRKQQIVKDTCNDIGRQSIVAKISEKSSLTLYPEMMFSWGKRIISRMLFQERKK